MVLRLMPASCDWNNRSIFGWRVGIVNRIVEVLIGAEAPWSLDISMISQDAVPAAERPKYEEITRAFQRIFAAGTNSL
ncbi:MAG: hypothetical protein DMG13_10940 [Acidobacteria bacterium]|nr:MAG: hypothetical protein DMG13_10940 [Acidobacteriota bacterium]